MDNMSKLLTAIENEGYAFKIDYEDQNGTHSCLDVDEFMSFYRHLMNVGWDRL